MWEVKFALIYPRAGRLAGAVLCPDEYVGRILHPAAAVFYSCGGEI